MVTVEQVRLFEKIRSQIMETYKETSILSKNKPDNPLNKFKLKLVNEILQQANIILSGSNKPFSDFIIFDEDNIPTNSDVVFILSQYINALEAWRSVNIVNIKFTWYWDTKNKNIPTDGEPTIFARER